MIDENFKGLHVGDIFHWNYYPSLYDAKKRTEADIKIIVNQGGTGSGKTYSILQVLFCKAIEAPNQVITVVGQDIPNLKVGALRDAQNILSNSPELQDFVVSFNSQDRVFLFKNGSIIEFKSYDNAQDAKSGKRDYLFINECNGVPYEQFFELHLRTKKRTFLDFNPTHEFWVHTHILQMPEAVRFISIYKHNKFLDTSIVDKILDLEHTAPDLWQIHGLGKTGKVEGLVFKNTQVGTEFPADCKRISYGLDFGFSNDVTALIKTGELAGNLYAQELIYQTGLLNKDISNLMKALEIPRTALIYADSADPKSIADLRLLGWNIQPAKKGADSVRNGISKIQSYPKVFILGTNFQKEAQQYKWKQKDGVSLNEPLDLFNHAWDACRYSLENKTLNTPKPSVY